MRIKNLKIGDVVKINYARVNARERHAMAKDNWPDGLKLIVC
jgi:hypothetical protein